MINKNYVSISYKCFFVDTIKRRSIFLPLIVALRIDSPLQDALKNVINKKFYGDK